MHLIVKIHCSKVWKTNYQHLVLWHVKILYNHWDTCYAYGSWTDTFLQKNTLDCLSKQIKVFVCRTECEIVTMCTKHPQNFLPPLWKLFWWAPLLKTDLSRLGGCWLKPVVTIIKLINWDNSNRLISLWLYKLSFHDS